jgi:Mg2+-importing ATPase
MVFFGPLSSVFDILCFTVMWWAIGANKVELSPLFQCGWFVFGTVSQVLVIHLIRTEKQPFVQSRPSMPLFFSTFIVAVLALFIGFSGLAIGLDMYRLPAHFIPWLVLILAGYLAVVQMMKKVYMHRYKEWM